MPDSYPVARPERTMIGVPQGASQTILFAADQLAYYLAIITGARFATGGDEPHITLQTGLPEAGDGAYRIRAAAGAIELTGADDLAVLHAVYHFLEAKCGCRWLAQFEGGEIVPRDTELSIAPCDELHAPVFCHRAFTNFPDINERTVEMVDWMCKNRFNRFMIFSNVAGVFERYQEILKPHLVLRGMAVEMGHHSFRYWLPPEEFFDPHPEWYAQIDGKRSTDAQVCTSNPAVAETMAERIAEFLAANPEIDMVGLWPNDGFGWCECADCATLEPQRPSESRAPHLARTDTYVRFVNEVARRVAKVHPGRRLSALAYVNYVEPPSIELQPTVDVCFAAFNRCYKHPFEGAADCTRQNARYAGYFDAWRERVPGSLYLFCYLMLIDTCSVPYPITQMLGPNFRWLSDHGCDGYVMEFKPEEWGPFGVNAHLIGRLSWDPELDVNAWLAGYYEDLYGPAAEEMPGFWRHLIEDFVQPGPCVYHYDLTYTRRATDELMAPALACLGRARAAAAGGEDRYREAVERACVGTQLLMRIGAWQTALTAASEAEGNKQSVLKNQAARLGRELVEWVDAHGDTDAISPPWIRRIVGL